MHSSARLTRKFLSAIFLLSTVAGLSKEAQACAGGDPCTPSWRLVHHNYDACNNLPFMSPANDSRVNLMLMMSDLRPGKLGTPGTLSYNPTIVLPTLQDLMDIQSSAPLVPVTDAFTVAVQADHDLKPEERDALLVARKTIQSGVAAGAAASAIATLEKVTKTASAKAYELYLEGAAQFWTGDYDKALATFSGLTNSQQAWVREVALYMVARVEINKAQVGAFEDYGTIKAGWKANPVIITAVEASLDKYLQQYPKGAYAQSTQGLKRRAYWLAQDIVKLDAEYVTLMKMSPEQRHLSDDDLLREMDHMIGLGYDNGSDAAKSIVKATQNPLILAMYDLQNMRSSDTPDDPNGQTFPPPPSIADLEQQKPYFAGQIPLYEYLLAVHAFYIDKKPADVLRLIPDASAQSSFSDIQFSRQMLRGLALDATKDPGALAFWKQLLPGASKDSGEYASLELAIALHEQHARDLSHVFAPGSLVQYSYFREVLLNDIADAALLRTVATNASEPQRERDVALMTLLYKEATRSDAAAFLKDLTLVPTDAASKGAYTMGSTDPIPVGIYLHGKADTRFACPSLKASEELLSLDASDPTAKLCVAEFVRLNMPGPWPPGPSAKGELGDPPSLFPGPEFSLLDTYAAVIANAKSTPNDKAYALYLAVNCYGPTGNNSCGGTDVPLTQRKAWFTTLKKDYGTTRWGHAQKYYW